MTAPNISAPTRLDIKPKGIVLTTSMADLLVCPTSHAYQVDLILVCNKSLTAKRKATIVLKTGGVEYELAYQTLIGIGQTFPPLYGKPAYLAEGDSIRGLGSANTDLVVTLHYGDFT